MSFVRNLAQIAGSALRRGAQATAGAAGRVGVRALEATGTAIARPSLEGVLQGAAAALWRAGSSQKMHQSLLRTGLPKFLALQGVSSALDYVADSPWGQEQAPITRFAMRAASFYSGMSGYRHLLKGAVGSTLYGAGRVQGDAARYFTPGVNGTPSLYSRSMRMLGGATRSGSALNWAAVKTASLGGKVAHQAFVAPFRMAAGTIGLGIAGAKVGTKAVRAALSLPLLPISRRAAQVVRGGSFDLGTALSVRAPRPLRAALSSKILPITNKAGELPLGWGAFGVGMAIGGINSVRQYDRYERGQAMYGPKTPGIDPRNWPRGMRSGRNRGAENFGPALTLGLHYKHARVL